MLTKITKTDKIEIVGEYKHIQVRVATIIEEDGVVLSSSFDRHVIAPGDNCSTACVDVQAIVAVIHTPELIISYQNFMASQNI